jgi:hypothetical protein
MGDRNLGSVEEASDPSIIPSSLSNRVLNDRRPQQHNDAPTYCGRQPGVRRAREQQPTLSE